MVQQDQAGAVVLLVVEAVEQQLDQVLEEALAEVLAVQLQEAANQEQALGHQVVGQVLLEQQRVVQGLLQVVRWAVKEPPRRVVQEPLSFW